MHEWSVQQKPSVALPAGRDSACAHSVAWPGMQAGGAGSGRSGSASEVTGHGFNREYIAACLDENGSTDLALRDMLITHACSTRFNSLQAAGGIGATLRYGR